MRFPRSTRKAFDSFVANVELVAALRASSRDTEGGCGLAEDAPMVMRRRRRANTSLVENARGWTGLVAMSWVVVAPYGDLKPFAGGDKHIHFAKPALIAYYMKGILWNWHGDSVPMEKWSSGSL
ncbi:hypothetical protein OPV22_022630 [Ensete ventricosum]|uniref:Uncharacterized protein n=1 Tax=Ensete ventricosum TaxID=4639 RepID=A0AAV8QUX1_ENSVE|nr:hypothetical protein OPV22_022630 [Ensete ventricosum]